MWLTLAALSGALAIAAGAFGAHGLRDRVTPEQVAAWSTAAQYHLIHSAVLVALALYALGAAERSIRLPGTLFLIGIVLFSGSIYLLVLTPWRWLGPITPIGGLFFIAGWLSLLTLARN